jgi:hypothetical protein
LLEDLERDGKWKFEEKPKENDQGKKKKKDEKYGRLKDGVQSSRTGIHGGREEKMIPSGHEVKKYQVDLPPTVSVAPPLASITPLTPSEEAQLRPNALAQIVEDEETEEQVAPIKQDTPTQPSSAQTSFKSSSNITKENIIKDPQGKFTKLLSELRIIERETPIDHVPAPPSLSPAAQEGISELAPLPVTTGKAGTSTSPTSGRTSMIIDQGTGSFSSPQVNTISSPSPIKGKEKARRQFMQKGSYITPAPGKAVEDVKTVSKEATAAYLAQESHAVAAARARAKAEDQGENTGEETDSEQELEDLIFEQMEAARKEMGE